MPTTSPISAEMAAALAQAEAIFEHGVDNAGASLSKTLQPIAVDNIRWLRNAPFDLPRAEGHREAGVAQTKGLGLEAAGVFEAYAVGSRIRITSRSIARYRLANAILSHPADGPPTKIRQPAARYQKRPRERTPQELEGLRKGNEGRALEAARKRREARTAARA
jgi:hypothetical protein